MAVVIPAYRVERHIARVIRSLPDFVSFIIVVNDASPDRTGQILKEIDEPRLQVITHPENLGVGGAMISGFRRALQLGAEIIVKMDGDEQMDPDFIPNLIMPILRQQADYTKGNRFYNLDALRQMPPLRRFGNTFLSFMTKLASGYWNISDMNNGFVAIHRNALASLDLSRIHHEYFFESSMLINLNIINAVVRDIFIPAKYGDEVSSLKIGRICYQFPKELLKGFFARFFWKYMMLDFTPTALFAILGVLLMAFGSSFGLWRWYISYHQHLIQSTGTVMLAFLPFMTGFHLCIQALVLDIGSVPKNTISFEHSLPSASEARR